MKLSIFTVSTPDLTPEALAQAAKAAGFHGIEWRYKEVPEEAKNEAPSFWRNNLCSISPFGGEAELERFKQITAESGLQTVSVTPYLTSGDLEATESVLQAARYMNASMIRLGIPAYNRSRHFNELFEQSRAYLREAAALCKQYGIKGVIETHHHTIAPSASSAYRLVEGLDPEAVGVLYDPGNMVHEGYENHRMGLELLGPYLAHVHVKNAGWFQSHDSKGEGTATSPVEWVSQWAGLQAGIVQWKPFISDLRSVGYTGYLGLEDFSGQFDSVAMLNYYAERMNTLLNEEL
ncbi:sugar phosphate isomerase/epimerase family protein [Paenibacillus abyssi]|uniref:Xylose isomerase-like TIM barrel domain-containing protein n=1 Tax=Paenibacillus abyssi TaxID=1340531 RepID=A0A917D2B8_9BACL|nr:sugar phosphate isomerase/epimerase family protein [Paenibacillus abyssi]GGG06639.1 hypothetical protein GCM10010916_24450 [Paenibacillus abyssi]